MSDAAQRLSELKKKLLLGGRQTATPPPAAEEAPLPKPSPRPLTSRPLNETKQADDGTTTVVEQKKAPLTLRSLMSTRNKMKQQPSASGSRLKEAPAHRAMLAESKSSLIRSKMISLSTKPPSSPEEPPQSVAQVIAKFELNPPPPLNLKRTKNLPLIASVFPPLSTDAFISEKREWLAQLGIPPSHDGSKRPRMTMTVEQFISHHRDIIGRHLP